MPALFPCSNRFCSVLGELPSPYRFLLASPVFQATPPRLRRLNPSFLIDVFLVFTGQLHSDAYSEAFL